MKRAEIKTMEFLSCFKIYENNEIETKFGDICSEFIKSLNDVDLSDDTLDHLTDLFKKDMKIFFEELRKEVE